MTERNRFVELDEATCLELLGAHHFGRVAVNDQLGPIVLPVNYVLDGRAVVFRTDAGTKLDAAARAAPASFQVDHLDEERRSGWSVLLRGTIREVTDPADLERVSQLPLDPIAGGERSRHVRVVAAALSGRRVAIPETLPEGWLWPPDLGSVWSRLERDDLGWS